ncbi:MAG: secretin N-terminal domain-containing protein [Methylovulum sp.]|nr:secretin N-terminal domain-containing protein [Methylovulum sp.]
MLNQPVISVALSLLLMSCSSVQRSAPNHSAEVFPQKTVPDFQKALPPATPDIPVPDFRPLPSSSRYLMQHPLNVSVREVDAREFFMGLVVDTDDNMLVHPEVKGVLSLELKNVNIPQVLDAVQKVYGYDYKKTDIGYVIYPATLQTKTFKIDRLDLLRKGRSNTIVSSGHTGNSSSGYGNQQSQNSFQQPNSNQMGAQSSGSSITTTTDADFWKELDDALRTLIAVDKEATFVINRQSGVIIARAKPMQLREIENFLSTIQDQISRQVILEAKILEVNLNDSHQDGVEWKSIIRQGLQIAPNMVNPAAAGGIYTLTANTGSFVAGDFTAIVTLLASQGNIKVLSSPRISTLNNQQAIIKVGKDETFVTGISPGITGGINSGNVQPAPILSQYFSGIALDVTPQINDADDITLHIHPSITKVQNQDIEYKIDGLGSTSVVPTALVTIRESDSIVKAQNSQIIVLGGLMQDATDENKEGVIGFSQIPYLGNLFRVNKGSSQKTELVILLKATLISNDADWQQERDASEQRFKALDAQPRWK